jgi:hypothetical protein
VYARRRKTGDDSSEPMAEAFVHSSASSNPLDQMKRVKRAIGEFDSGLTRLCV